MRRFTINLTEIGGEGEFPCPQCKETISPEDDSGKVYDVLETEEEDDSLNKVIIECKKCGSIIKLEGFDLFKEIGHPEMMFESNDYLQEWTN